jgi:hypothetical protein
MFCVQSFYTFECTKIEIEMIELVKSDCFSANQKLLATVFAILFSMSFSATTFAQGTLQFNRVFLVGNSEEIVPAGKVWKVESVIYSSSIANMSGGSVNQNDNILVDGTTVTVRASRSGNGGMNAVAYASWEQKFPFWLNAGARLQTSTNVFRISVIEFNILP